MKTCGKELLCHQQKPGGEEVLTPKRTKWQEGQDGLLTRDPPVPLASGTPSEGPNCRRVRPSEWSSSQPLILDTQRPAPDRMKSESTILAGRLRLCQLVAVNYGWTREMLFCPNRVLVPEEQV